MGAGIDFCGMIDRYLSLDGALGAELQQAMTPAEAVELLKDGVRRSTSGETSTRNRTALLSDAAGGQYPYAAVLSCIDSRAPVEQIFDAASGDLFVARVAGNVASPDLTASLEYATKYAGSKAILVLGHTRCGAVKGAWAGLEDGHLTGLLGRIQPAVDATKSEVGAEDSADNLDRCSQVNVRKTMAALRSDSSILAGLEAEGKIAIVGGVYDVATGEVAWLD
jgi:carbonic anhydrase